MYATRLVFGWQRTASALAIALLIPACGLRPDESKRSSGTVPSTEGNVAAHFRRGTEKLKDQNDLNQFAKFYVLYENDNGKPAASLPVFVSYIERDAPKLAKDLQAGRYVVNWGTPLSPTAVLAYEKNVDLNGNQVVVMTDGSVHTMKAAELQKELTKGG